MRVFVAHFIIHIVWVKQIRFVQFFATVGISPLTAEVHATLVTKRFFMLLYHVLLAFGGLVLRDVLP